MKINIKFSTPFALLAGLLLTTYATPAQAQFTVFDPTSYVVFGHIWAQDVATGIKVAETVTQGAGLLSQGLQIYNLAMLETNALRHKEWYAGAGYLSHLNIPGHPEWTLVLRSGGGMPAAIGVWGQMTNPGMSLPYRIQIADAFGASMADALGGCNAGAMTTDLAIGGLQSVSMSMETLDNTRAALGGITNMGISQQLRIQECQHNLQQQQAQLQMLQLMRERDYDNAQYATYQNIDSIAASNPKGITNLSGLMLADF